MSDMVVARGGAAVVSCGRVPVRDRPKVKAWATALKTLFDSCGLSQSLFCDARDLIDKGSLSRYLRGERVPSSPWLLTELFALREAAGSPVTEAVKEHLKRLHLDALDAAHPHEYRVLLIRDKLNVATVQLRETRRLADHLQDELDDRNRRLDEHAHRLTDLAADNRRLRDAWDDHAARLQAEIDSLNDRLAGAQRAHYNAEASCRHLQELLSDLTTPRRGSARAITTPSRTTPKTEESFTWSRRSFMDGLSIRATHALLELGAPRVLSRGEVLVRQGELGRTAHLVLSGRFNETLVAENGTQTLIGLRYPGDLVDETVLRSEFHGTTMTARDPATVLTIPVPDILSYLVR